MRDTITWNDLQVTHGCVSTVAAVLMSSDAERNITNLEKYMKAYSVKLANGKKFTLPRNKVVPMTTRVMITFPNGLVRTFAPWYVELTKVKHGRG